MEKITQQELKNLIDRNKRTCVLDARTLREYLDSRIKNIPFIPLELLNHIRQPEARWSKSKPVYVISYTEARSKAFCHKLDAWGYHTFYVEESGVKAWCKQDLSCRATLIDHKNTNKSALLTTNDTESKPVFNFEVAIKPIPPLGHYFRSIIGIAWFFEKMNCNIKFVFAKGFNYFENSTLKVSPESSSDNYIALSLYMREFDRYCRWITSDYAYSVMSRLTIKKEIQEEADQWIRANLKGNWIGVHLRGTDRKKCDSYFIEMDTYISYLKKVLDKHLNIFVCSDQAQFIDQMHRAFPGRVFSRDIDRSYDERKLQKHPLYGGTQQRRDALLDLLILSKSNLIYKAAGEFSHLTRFFNPDIKIVSSSLSGYRYRKYRSENFVRIPKPHVLVKQSFLKYHYGKLCLYLKYPYRKLHAWLRNI